MGVLFFVDNVSKLSVSRMVRWLMNGKGFERKGLLSNQVIITAFAWRTEENHENLRITALLLCQRTR
jgi:hypothetical protein